MIEPGSQAERADEKMSKQSGASRAGHTGKNMSENTGKREVTNGRIRSDFGSQIMEDKKEKSRISEKKRGKAGKVSMSFCQEAIVKNSFLCYTVTCRSESAVYGFASENHR